MAKNPQTLSKYLRSQQDMREDRANARIVGMPVKAFKITPEAKEIDRQIVLLNRKQAKRK